MKIKSVRATPVHVPVTRIAAFSKLKLTHVKSTIVEVETASGVVGLGEARGDWGARIINQCFADAIVGLPADDRRAVRDACLAKAPFDYGYPEYLPERSAFAAIEEALWDIAGKEAGVPLYRLLGGAVRERAPFVAYAYAVDPDEGRSDAEIARVMADIAASSVNKTGASMFEFKVGLHSPACEIGVVRAVREALGPDVDISVDANMGFSVEQARRFLAGVADQRLANIEEPVAGLGAIERLRAEFGVPVSTHCVDLDALGRYRGIDSVVSDPQLMGGIGEVIELAIGVRALNKRFWLRARWELGIAWAVMCHLGMARPELNRPSQALIDWVEDDLILGDTWLVTNGGVRPPDAPGLGVELDRAAMKRYAVS
ncbi:MAG: mandelate racemase/muconate lactonizing enzyme family protein [Rhodospirillales bacterium]|jgi:glucarate dehydratase|nr:mandelate racemase/muconate lactonizing enzyme family protein [Rhodospirillales bacterium]